MSLLLLFRSAVQAIIAPVTIAPEYYPVGLQSNETALDFAAPMMTIGLEPKTLSADLNANTIAADI